MITLHRVDPDGLPSDDRIALPVENVMQVHEGKGGYTIVTTPSGRLCVQDDFDAVVKAVEKERKNAART